MSVNVIHVGNSVLCSTYNPKAKKMKVRDMRPWHAVRYRDPTLYTYLDSCMPHGGDPHTNRTFADIDRMMVRIDWVDGHV
jgi:hypothetical protein